MPLTQAAAPALRPEERTMPKSSKQLHEERINRGQRRIALWVTVEQEAQLKAGAEAAEMSVSDAIRLSLEASGLIEVT